MAACQRAVLLDVDGTLLDTLANLREVWTLWSDRHGLEPHDVVDRALTRRPLETFADVAAHLDPQACLDVLDEIENDDARHGRCVAFDGAEALLTNLLPGDWAIVTSNYHHRVRLRFERTGLPLPTTVIDAAAVDRGKPDPQGYLLAAAALGRAPSACLVIEDSESGIRAARAAEMAVWAVHTERETHAARLADRVYPGLADAVPDIIRWRSSGSG